VVHLGDFVHDPVKCSDYVKLYNNAGISTFHTLGNHDTEGCSLAQTLDAYNLECGHYHFDRNGFRFVVLDTNYFSQDGRFVHFELGNYRKVPYSRSWSVGDAQYEWLEDVLKNSPCPCVVFMHQSCERESGGMPDWARMRGLFRWVNRHKGPKVRLVVNGHHHTDAFRFIDGIAYLDLNSANYKYYAQRHKLYPEQYHKAHSAAGNVIAWDGPISAVITMDTDGFLKIEGQKAKYLYGVSPEKAKFPKRDRPVKPEIQSLEMTVNIHAHNGLNDGEKG
jgi:3',5'-cyclic AMP phosphodiesterase CpdA